MADREAAPMAAVKMMASALSGFGRPAGAGVAGATLRNLGSISLSGRALNALGK
jgi:hypothetical protein